MNDEIDILSYSTNLGSGIICAVLGTLLLCFNTEQKEDRKGYVVVKRFLAIAAFLATASNTLVNYAILRGMDFRFLLIFITPCICYWQLHTCTVSLLALIHSKKATLASRIHWVLPIIILSLVHIGGFIAYEDDGSNLLGKYAYYCCTPFSQALTYLLFITIGGEFAFYAILLLTEVRRFIGKIDNYFTGRTEDRVKTLALIVRCFIIYFVFAGVDFVVSSTLDGTAAFILNAAFMWVNTGAFVVSVIVIINMQNVYFSSAPAFTLEDEPLDESKGDEAAEENGAQGTTIDVSISPIGDNMEQIVRRWSDKPGKPYLGESITLADAATEMAISPRLLSGFLNSVYGMNFNTWINTLRVEEVKRILSAEASLSMAEVANRTGFTDASALSRTFKRIAGETPSNYRNAMRA